MKDAFARPRFDDAAGDVAGADDRIVAIVRHFQAIEQALHRRTWPRRVGEKDHRAAAGAKAFERVTGLRKRGDAVVHYPPDVAKKDIVIARERGKSFDDFWQGRWR